MKFLSIILILWLANGCSNSVSADYEDTARLCQTSPDELRGKSFVRVLEFDAQNIRATLLNHHNPEPWLPITPGSCVILPETLSRPVVIYDIDKSKRVILNPQNLGTQGSTVELQASQDPVFDLSCSEKIFSKGEWRPTLTYSSDSSPVSNS